jgi:hypothetical protein
MRPTTHYNFIITTLPDTTRSCIALLDMSGHLIGDTKMNASEQIDGLIAKLSDWRGTTLANVRRIIHDADPEIIEEWKWMGSPVWSHDGMVCVANAFKDKVKVTFYLGAHLADPDRLFNNGLEGKQWRTIDIYKDDNINEGSLKALIQAAVDYNHAKVKTANKPPAIRGNKLKKPAK